ncbi:MAG: S8 family serine peptidase [Elusimicrobiota bacterium]
MRNPRLPPRLLSAALSAALLLSSFGPQASAAAAQEFARRVAPPASAMIAPVAFPPLGSPVSSPLSAPSLSMPAAPSLVAAPAPPLAVLPMAKPAEAAPLPAAASVAGAFAERIARPLADPKTDVPAHLDRVYEGGRAGAEVSAAAAGTPFPAAPSGLSPASARAAAAAPADTMPPPAQREARSARFPFALAAAAALGGLAAKILGAGATAIAVAGPHPAAIGAIVGAALIAAGAFAVLGAADAVVFAATMLRGRGATDEQFRAFVRREVMAGRLDANAAALLKPYRPQGRFTDLTFAFAARGTIWIRPELIASPFFFRVALVHELSHWTSAPTRGPPQRGVRGLLSSLLSESRARASELRGPGALKDLAVPALERAMRQAQISLKLARPYEILVVNPDTRELSDPALYAGLSNGAATVTTLAGAEPAKVFGAATGKDYQAVVLGRPAALLPEGGSKDALRLETALKQLDSLYVLATRLISRPSAFIPGSSDARAFGELSEKAERLRAAGSPAKEMASFEKDVRKMWRQIAEAKLKGVAVSDLLDGIYGGLRDRGTAFLSFSPEDRGVAVWERLLRYWESADGGQFRVTRVDLENGGHILMLRKIEARVGLWLRPLAAGRIETSVPRANESEEGRAAARASLEAAGFAEQLKLFDSLGVSVRHAFGADAGRQEIYITVPRRNASAIRKVVAARAESSIGRSRADFETHLADSAGLQDVPPVWRAGITGAGGRIMWIDTGADAAHEDFGGRLDVIDMVNEGPEDWVGHGTHVAGISISGHAGFFGMAKEAAGLMAKVFSREGQGAPDGEIMGSALIAQQRGMDVISLSLGSRGSSSDNLADFFSQLTHQKNANGEYPIVTSSAGNSGPFDKSLSQPAAGADVLAVAAAAKSLDDGKPEIAFYSSVGPDLDRRYAVKRWRLKPEITGIGGDVVSKIKSATVYLFGVFSARSKDAPASAADLPDGRHTGMSGTSMSNPAVAAIALLVKLAMKASGAMTPFISENLPFAIKAVLMRSAKDLEAPVWFQGAGLVQAGAAVKLVFGARISAAEGWAWIERLKAVADAEDRAFLEAGIPKSPDDEPQAGDEDGEEGGAREMRASEEEPSDEGEQPPDPAAASHAAQNAAIKRFNAAREREAPALIEALKDPVWLVRQRAAFALMNLRSPSAAMALAGAGLNDSDSRVRQTALLALAEIPTHSVDALLQKASADPRWDVGAYAAYALARRGDRSGAPRIAAETSSPDKRARYAAAWLTGQLGAQAGPAEGEALSARVKDRAERGNIRHLATAALSNLADASPEAISDRVVTDLLEAAGPENIALTRTIAKFFPSAINDRNFVARLRRDPMKAIVTSFVLRNKGALLKPGALAELVQLLARAADVPLDSPTPTPYSSGTGVPGVDGALGPVDLIITPPTGAPSAFVDETDAERISRSFAAAGLDAAMLRRGESIARAALPLSGALWLSVPEHKLYALTLALEARRFVVRRALPEYPLARGGDAGPGTLLDLGNGESRPEIPQSAGVSLVRVRADAGVSEARVMAALERLAAGARGPLVIALTLGAPTGRRTELSALVDKLAANGVGVVVGAGNAGPAPGTVASPGDAALAVVVAAASREKGLQFYSSRGEPEAPRVSWADLVEQLDPGRTPPPAADAVGRLFLNVVEPADPSASPLGTAVAAERTAEKLARLAVIMAEAFTSRGRALPAGWFPFLASVVASAVTPMPAHSAYEVGAGLFDDEGRARGALTARLSDLDAVEREAAALVSRGEAAAAPRLEHESGFPSNSLREAAHRALSAALKTRP